MKRRGLNLRNAKDLIIAAGIFVAIVGVAFFYNYIKQEVMRHSAVLLLCLLLVEFLYRSALKLCSRH